MMGFTALCSLREIKRLFLRFKQREVSIHPPSSARFHFLKAKFPPSPLPCPWLNPCLVQSLPSANARGRLFLPKQLWLQALRRGLVLVALSLAGVHLGDGQVSRRRGVALALNKD